MRYLIVIDMQKQYAGYKLALSGVLSRIRKAKREGRTIVIVEYADSGPTCHEVMNEVRTYGYVIVTKDRDGGGDQVRQALSGYLQDNDKVEVCGVNTCWCVRRTALGLGVPFEYHPDAVACVSSCGEGTDNRKACLRRLAEAQARREAYQHDLP